MAASDYRDAPEVRGIAKELISRYHRELDDPEVRILYVFRLDEPKHLGNLVWAQAVKVSGRAAYLLQRDLDVDEGDFYDEIFMIEVNRLVWATLTEDQKVALIDHELAHCGLKWSKEGKLKLTMIPHDLEEFKAIYQRHGAWRESIQEFLDARAQQQIPLGLDTIDAETGEIRMVPGGAA